MSRDEKEEGRAGGGGGLPFGYFSRGGHILMHEEQPLMRLYVYSKHTGARGAQGGCTKSVSAHSRPSRCQ